MNKCKEFWIFITKLQITNNTISIWRITILYKKGPNGNTAVWIFRRRFFFNHVLQIELIGPTGLFSFQFSFQLNTELLPIERPTRSLVTINSLQHFLSEGNSFCLSLCPDWWTSRSTNTDASRSVVRPTKLACIRASVSFLMWRHK